MAAIRRADTGPEKRLRSMLHARGLRFRKDHRLHLSGGAVRPDIVFSRVKVAVFYDDCFWHSCADHGRQPTRNVDYWGPKLRRNTERDRRDDAVLREAGWRVVRVWAHESLVEAARSIDEAVRMHDPSIVPGARRYS